MAEHVEYIKGAELGDLEVRWEDADGVPINMESGYSFEVAVGSVGKPADFEKTTGISGTTTGLTITWATSGELNSLARGNYTIELRATRTSDNRDRIRHIRLKIIDAIT